MFMSIREERLRPRVPGWSVLQLGRRTGLVRYSWIVGLEKKITDEQITTHNILYMNVSLARDVKNTDHFQNSILQNTAVDFILLAKHV